MRVARIHGGKSRKKTEYTTYDFPMDTVEWYKLWFLLLLEYESMVFSFLSDLAYGYSRNILYLSRSVDSLSTEMNVFARYYSDWFVQLSTVYIEFSSYQWIF